VVPTPRSKAIKGNRSAGLARWEVKSSQLRWRCSVSGLGFETTDELQYRPNIIGQERALDAMRLGLTIRSPGYNIYISGLSGTGKLTAIRYMLDGMDLRRKGITDICYVHNFETEEQPTCLMLPGGTACKLREQLLELKRAITEFVPAALRSEQFKRRQATIANQTRERRDKLLHSLEKEVNQKGFSLVQVEHEGFARPEIAPRVLLAGMPSARLPGTRK